MTLFRWMFPVKHADESKPAVEDSQTVAEICEEEYQDLLEALGIKPDISEPD